MSEQENYRMIVDPEWGYRRLDPLPDDNELSAFYKESFYQKSRQRGAMPEISRVREGGEEAAGELDWLAETLWSDIADHVMSWLHPGGPRILLDIGCGLGHFACYMQQRGWDAWGIEVAPDAFEHARSIGISVCRSVEAIPSDLDGRFTLVTMLNVLEHVARPVQMLNRVKELMVPTGILVVRVPNDFTLIQDCARKALGKEAWWVAIPDHINYFNHESLVELLRRLGYEVLHETTDFPMELFLLMGEDYVGNHQLGSDCHKKRRAFENSISKDLRRRFYDCLAQNGMGRNCLCFARPVETKA